MASSLLEYDVVQPLDWFERFMDLFLNLINSKEMKQYKHLNMAFGIFNYSNTPGSSESSTT